MGGRRDAWLSQNGLKLIRVVIGSYFCAMAMGVPMGFDPFFLLGLVVPGETGRIIGAAALLTLAIAFICGVRLRLVSLMLAGFMIFSAIVKLVLVGDLVHVGALWQSIAFGAAVMMSYATLKPHELHRTAHIPVRTVRGAVARDIKERVAPRRVRPKRGNAKTERPDPFARSFGPLIAPTEQMIGGVLEDRPRRTVEPERIARVEEDVDNIFVNI